jgi:hypothetical protein
VSWSLFNNGDSHMFLIHILLALVAGFELGNGRR